MANQKSKRKSREKKPKTTNTENLQSRILDCIRKEVEASAGELVPPISYNKQVVIAGGGYIKGRYSKGDALPERLPAEGHLAINVDVKLEKRTKRRKRPKK
jgi:hypothetical protein